MMVDEAQTQAHAHIVQTSFLSIYFLCTTHIRIVACTAGKRIGTTVLYLSI